MDIDLEGVFIFPLKRFRCFSIWCCVTCLKKYVVAKAAWRINATSDLGKSNIQARVSGMYLLPWSLKMGNAYCPFSA